MTSSNELTAEKRAYNYLAFNELYECWVGDERIFSEVPRNEDGSWDDEGLEYFNQDHFDSLK